MNKFSENLKRIRETRGYTQKEMAEQIPVSRTGYWYYEKNEREPDFNTLIRISKILEVSTDELLGINEKEDVVGKIDAILKNNQISIF